LKPRNSGRVKLSLCTLARLGLARRGETFVYFDAFYNWSSGRPTQPISIGSVSHSQREETMSRSPWVTVVPLLLFLWPGAGSATPQTDGVAVQLYERVNNHIVRSTYTLCVEPNHAELIVDRDLRIGQEPELRFTAWKGDSQTFRDDPSISIDNRLSYLRVLMSRFLKTEPQLSSYRLLFYGYSDLHQQLPGLVARDGGWDLHSGRPKSGENDYLYLQKLLNKSNAYQELAAVVNEFHYRVRIEGGMENLRVLPVSMLSKEQEMDLPDGLQKSDLLPARVSIDFLLTQD
jgi:hypothetical protein